MKEKIDEKYSQFANPNNRQLIANDIVEARRIAENLLPGYTIEAIFPLSVINAVIDSNLKIKLTGAETRIPLLKKEVISNDWKSSIVSMFAKKETPSVSLECELEDYFSNHVANAGEGDIFEIECINPGTRELISILGKAAASNQALDCYIVTHPILIRIAGKKIKNVPEAVDVDHPLVFLVVSGISHRMAVIYRGYTTPINLTRMISESIGAEKFQLSVSYVSAQLRKYKYNELAKLLQSTLDLYHAFVGVVESKFEKDEISYSRAINSSKSLIKDTILSMLEVVSNENIGIKCSSDELQQKITIMSSVIQKLAETAKSLEENVVLSESVEKMIEVLDFFKEQSKYLVKKMN